MRRRRYSRRGKRAAGSLGGEDLSLGDDELSTEGDDLSFDTDEFPDTELSEIGTAESPLDAEAESKSTGRLKGKRRTSRQPNERPTRAFDGVPLDDLSLEELNSDLSPEDLKPRKKKKKRPAPSSRRTTPDAPETPPIKFLVFGIFGIVVVGLIIGFTQFANDNKKDETPVVTAPRPEGEKVSGGRAVRGKYVQKKVDETPNRRPKKSKTSRASSKKKSEADEKKRGTEIRNPKNGDDGWGDGEEVSEEELVANIDLDAETKKRREDERKKASRKKKSSKRTFVRDLDDNRRRRNRKDERDKEEKKETFRWSLPPGGYADYAKALASMVKKQDTLDELEMSVAIIPDAFLYYFCTDTEEIAAFGYDEKKLKQKLQSLYRQYRTQQGRVLLSVSLETKNGNAHFFFQKKVLDHFEIKRGRPRTFSVLAQSPKLRKEQWQVFEYPPGAPRKQFPRVGLMPFRDLELELASHTLDIEKKLPFSVILSDVVKQQVGRDFQNSINKGARQISCVRWRDLNIGELELRFHPRSWKHPRMPKSLRRLLGKLGALYKEDREQGGDL
ncbi:MAG: hypothetical protein AAF517_03810 [Planctomycetota bacterium]